MAKLIPTLLGVFAITAAAIGVGLLMQPSSEPATAVSFRTTTNDDATTAATTTGREAGEDVSGPCDEAEHANDPRCAGAAGAVAGTTAVTTTAAATTTTGREAGEDVSGPCDEAEHANDPRCTGAATSTDDRGRDDGATDDRSGSDSGRGGGDDDSGGDDRSGSNSGHGGSGSGDDD